MSDPSRFSEAFRLRSGVAALVRAIRPDDRERLHAAFLELDPESVYLRYFSYKADLSEADLDRLCDPDFRERVVLVVTIAGAAGEVIIAAAGYVAYDTPEHERAAEVAFSVEEDFHGQGISGKLLAVLTTIARADGIDRFEAEVLARNAPMLHVFERSGLPMQHEPAEDGVVRVSLSLLAAPSPAAASR
ncbi:MAG TPA: GNAT family protein [Burkholderiaceae bacterium]|nr:GNAT family protein [Burkholderiaceae bacterium]